MVEDDEVQVRRARKLLEEAAEADEPIFITDVVLSELEWVLESAYRVPRLRILAAVNELVADTRFSFEDRKRVSSALKLYHQGQGDLADYLIALRAVDASVRTTFTFNRGLRGVASFTVV